MRELLDKIKSINEEVKRREHEKDEVFNELEEKITEIMLGEGFDKDKFSLRFYNKEYVVVDLIMGEISVDSLISLQENFGVDVSLSYGDSFSLVFW